MSILRSNLKKVVCTFLCCAMLILGTGIMANAAISGYRSGSSAHAELTNPYSTKRYCQLAIRQYDTSKKSATTVASSSAVIKDDALKVNAESGVTKKYAYAYGTIYKGNVPQSGIASTCTKNLGSK